MTIATMKKFMKSLMLVAVAAMGLTACQNDINEQVNATKGEVTVTFIANSADATRTSVSIDADKNVTFAWDEEESFVVLESIDGAAPTQALSVDFENVDGLAEISATFEENFDGLEYDYVAVYPATAWAESNTTLSEAELIIPAEQTMAAASYDPAADLMISDLLALDIQPSNEALEMRFQRLVAVGKITVNGIPAGEVMKSVEFAAEGVTLAGSVVVDLVNAEIGEAKTSSNSVVVNTTNATSNEVYFTCMPATLEPETNYTIIVTTDKGAYIKTGTITKALEFKAGDVTGFKANMSTATKSEWQLVKNVEELEAGDIVIIAAKGANSAMSTEQKNNNRGAADITKVGDFLAEPSATVQQFTIVNGTKENTFAFYDRARKMYLYAASSSSNYLRSQETIDNNGSWAITIANTGVATVKAQGTNTRNWMRFNDANFQDSGLLFSCYGSGQKDICIYKYLSGKGAIPVIPVTINAQDITIENVATNADTKIEEISFDNIGEWNISVAEVEDADWLTVEYNSEEQAIYYTAEENTGEARYAEVRITASLEGEEDIIREFNINQNGVIVEELMAIDNTQRYIFKKVTEMKGGKWYAIIANGKAMTAITSNYGYGQVLAATVNADNTTSLPASCAFGFLTNGGGYTMQQYDDKYLYQTGTFNSFNVATTVSSGHIWTVSMDDDGVATITNSAVSKYIQLDSQYGTYGSYNSVKGTKPELYELVEVDNTPIFESISATSLSFSHEAQSKDVTVTTSGIAELTAISDMTWATATINGNTITIAVELNEGEVEREATITVTFGDDSKTVTVKQSAKSADGEVGGGEDDFATIKSTNTSYVTGKTTAGWNYKNCAILQGGTKDSNPTFKMIGEASNRALCMNGKKGAVGSITSPTLTGGCGTLTFNYGLPFSDNKIKFRVDIMQNGEAVKTFTIDKSSASKLTLYEHEEVINVAGDFQIVFTNLSPSNSSSNKDRTAIWDVVWDGYAQ